MNSVQPGRAKSGRPMRRRCFRVARLRAFEQWKCWRGFSGKILPSHAKRKRSSCRIEASRSAKQVVARGAQAARNRRADEPDFSAAEVAATTKTQRHRGCSPVLSPFCAGFLQRLHNFHEMIRCHAQFAHRRVAWRGKSKAVDADNGARRADVFPPKPCYARFHRHAFGD